MNALPRRILAIDHGAARTGLAATDWTGTIVVPLPRVDTRDTDRLVKAIVELVAERDTECIVIGLALAGDGGEGQRAKDTRAFAARLAQATKVPIEFVDETHTTDEAHERLAAMGLRAAQRRQAADSVAAMVILERFRAALGRRPRLEDLDREDD